MYNFFLCLLLGKAEGHKLFHAFFLQQIVKSDKNCGLSLHTITKYDSSVKFQNLLSNPVPGCRKGKCIWTGFRRLCVPEPRPEPKRPEQKSVRSSVCRMLSWYTSVKSCQGLTFSIPYSRPECKSGMKIPSRWRIPQSLSYRKPPFCIDLRRRNAKI